MIAGATIAAIDAAHDTSDDVERALAFERAIDDARALIARLQQGVQRAILDAQADGKSLDTIAVEMGITRDRLNDMIDGKPPERAAEFVRSAPAHTPWR